MSQEHQHHHHHHGHEGGDHQPDFFVMEDILRRDFELKKQKMFEFLDKVGPKEGQHVLEVGCGFAPLLERYCDAIGPAGSVTLVDPEARLADRLAPRLAGRANVRFLVGRAEDLPAMADAACPAAGPPGYYDLAVMVNVYHHLDDIGAALAAVRDRLRPGTGRLLVFDFVHDTFRLFAPPEASAAAAAVRDRLSELMRPHATAASAVCAPRLEASGFAVRTKDCYVLQDSFKSALGDFYTEAFLPHSLGGLLRAGKISEAERAQLMERDLPALRQEPGAVLFSDIYVMLAADRLP